VNYTLSLSLDGFDKVDTNLDKLLSKVGLLGNLENFQIDNLIDESGFLKAGDEAAKKFASSFGKGLKGLFEPIGKEKNVSGQGLAGLINPQKPEEKKDNETPSEKVKKFDFKGLFFGAITTMFNPFVGARMLSDVVGKGGAGGIAKGIFGKGGAEGYAEIFVAVKSLQYVVKVLTSTIRDSINIESKLYTQAVTQGLSTNFLASRNTISKILGVNPDSNEMFRFGSAVQYVQFKTKDAIKTFGESAIPLKKLDMDFKIVITNFEALGVKLTTELAPAIEFVLSKLDHLSTFHANTPEESRKQNNENFFSSFPEILAKIGGTMPGGTGSKDDYFGLMGQEDVLEKVKKLGDGGLGKLADAAGLDKIQKQMFVRFVDENKKALGKNPELHLNDPGSFMKQLPASTWEKMGLVVGGGNSTKDLIKKSNGYLQIIARAVSNNPSGTAFQFGMNPRVSNP